MLQPVTRACVLGVLMMVAVAEAQPQAPRGRSVTVASKPGDPLPEVRVAAGGTTTIVLDARVDKHSVQVDATRFRVVDVGERSLVLETLEPPGEKERWVLRVRYADGAQPEWAAFALVSHPGEVDLQILAARQRQTLESCHAMLAAAQARCEGTRAEVWVLADRLAGGSVLAAPIDSGEARGWVYRLGDRVLLVVTPTSAPGQPPWTPTAATLSDGRLPFKEVEVRAVHVRERLAPGEQGTVAVEAGLPSPEATHVTLVLRDAAGRSLTIKDVKLPTAQGTKGAGR